MVFIGLVGCIEVGMCIWGYFNKLVNGNIWGQEFVDLLVEVLRKVVVKIKVEEVLFGMNVSICLFVVYYFNGCIENGVQGFFNSVLNVMLFGLGLLVYVIGVVICQFCEVFY